MVEARLRFSTDILRRLGEELNPQLDRGVLELVKNAYDADAEHCHVHLVATDEPGGTVRVTDDGVGMTMEELAGGFLLVGKSAKVEKDITGRGRIPAGDKGLGRLAALRLGRSAEVLSRPAAKPQTQLELVIDWDDFAAASTVDEVPLAIIERPVEGDAKQGTEITVSGLSRRVRRMEVKRLARAMILLADPFDDDPDAFKPVLHTSAFADLERLVANRYFDYADYHLVATLDEAGHARAQVLDWKGQPLFSADHSDLAADRDAAPYQSPPADFDFWVFILSRQAFTSRPITVGEVSEWLQGVGGVHLYVNRLRVSPYGDPEDDWLALNLGRVRSPEERPGTNTSIGRVRVRDHDDLLLQKTDRSGIIESESFAELRAFAKDATEWMAHERLRVAERRRAKARTDTPKKSNKARQAVQAAIDEVPPRAKKELTAAFGKYERARERETEALRREVQLYRTLSTAGITAATFAHEVTGSPAKIIGQAVRAVERRAKKILDGQYDDQLREPVELIKRSLQSWRVLSSATLRLVDHEKRRPGRVEPNSVIANMFKTFQPFLEGRSVEVDLSLCGGSPYFRGTEAAVESIVTNLISNSLAAFERASTRDRRVSVATEVQDEVLSLVFEDNGPGIDGVSTKHIWNPGITTNPGGTGLGLTIVRDTVADLGGDVEVVANGPLGGARFTIRLPLLGV